MLLLLLLLLNPDVVMANVHKLLGARPGRRPHGPGRRGHGLGARRQRRQLRPASGAPSAGRLLRVRPGRRQAEAVQVRRLDRHEDGAVARATAARVARRGAVPAAGRVGVRRGRARLRRRREVARRGARGAEGDHGRDDGLAVDRLLERARAADKEAERGREADDGDDADRDAGYGSLGEARSAAAAAAAARRARRRAARGRCRRGRRRGVDLR